MDIITGEMSYHIVRDMSIYKRWYIFSTPPRATLCVVVVGYMPLTIQLKQNQRENCI